MPSLAELMRDINKPPTQGALPNGSLFGLLNLGASAGGIAPYGLRHSGEGAKLNGFFGPLKRPDGSFSSELSTENDIGGKNVEHPLLVPTLSFSEIQHLLADKEPTPEIYRKSIDHAAMRIQQGKSPFAGYGDLYFPLP